LKKRDVKVGAKGKVIIVKYIDNFIEIEKKGNIG
jgi:hypothetical protein